jgi:hypothetical protein
MFTAATMATIGQFFRPRTGKRVKLTCGAQVHADSADKR